MTRRLVAGLLVASRAVLSLGALAGFATTRSQLSERLLHADPHWSAAAAGRPTAPADPAAVLATISQYAAGVPEQPAPIQAHQGLWIDIPSLKISLPIREGDGSDRIPQWVALHYPGTATPGAPGNSYLYAHGLWRMFGGVLFARVGDRVALHDYTRGAVQTMRVSRVVGRTNWSDTSWIQSAADRAHADAADLHRPRPSWRPLHCRGDVARPGGRTPALPGPLSAARPAAMPPIKGLATG